MNAKSLIIDLDGTLTIDENLSNLSTNSSHYLQKKPNLAVVKKLKEFRDKGFRVVIFTSRNMRSFNGNIEQIKEQTLPDILKWLQMHEIPYDDVIVGKAWCGFEGFYVDDKAIRPSEFANLSEAQIHTLLEKERKFNLSCDLKNKNLTPKKAKK